MKDNGIPTDALESGKRKVLLVDDDVELVELMTKVLEEDGRFEVRVASNGFDAGMMVKEYRPDLIVLDVMLPDINGKEVCHRVRADPTLEDVRILCISGMIEEDKIQELRLSGADDFLHKPFDIEDLIDHMCALAGDRAGVHAGLTAGVVGGRWLVVREARLCGVLTIAPPTTNHQPSTTNHRLQGRSHRREGTAPNRTVRPLPWQRRSRPCCGAPGCRPPPRR